MEMKVQKIETALPEAIIQHIQSLLSEKEAARTTLLSQSWYAAWLTRPTLVFDQRRFKKNLRSSPIELAEFATQTMQRYRDSNLKIESFTLRTQSCRRGIEFLSKKLIVDAIKMGVTDLNLEFRPPAFSLPPEVLRSETLLRLSVSGCDIDGIVSCPMLKSLSLDSVLLKGDDVIRDLIRCCISIEELSLSNSSPCKSRKIAVSGRNLYELHKLRRLHLEMLDVDNSFFDDDFDSRFPCLQDMGLVSCHGYRGIRIASTSLQRISIVQPKVMKVELNVPNLAYFSYSGMGVPSSLSIEAKEWESVISMQSHTSQTSSWYLRMHKLLTRLSLSKITLSVNMLAREPRRRHDKMGDIINEALAGPVVVENLTIEAASNRSCALLVDLFWICRPKIVTHYWLPAAESVGSSRDDWSRITVNLSLRRVWEKLMERVMSPNCGLPDQNMFGRFRLKQVNVEVYEEINHTEWRPLVLKETVDVRTPPPNKRKVCFHLKWF